MADQDVEYRIKLDTSDLASQLQQVKAQMDQVLGAQAFGTVMPAQQPALFTFPMQQTLANANLVAMNTAQQAVDAGKAGFSDLNGLATATRLGFQKFNNDVMTSYLTTGVPMFTSSQGTPTPDLYGMGMFRATAGNVLGLGYNPAMPMTPGEYQRRAGYEMERQAVNFAANTGFGLIGGAVGTFFGGPIGGAVGAIAGGFVGDAAYDVAASTVLRDYEQARSIRDLTFNTSWRTLAGRFSRAESLRIGETLAPIARSEALVGYEVTNTDVTRVMQEFTSMGGFENVRTAEEYRNRAKDVIENHRKVMQLLRMTEDDALQYMKTMQNIGLGGDVAGRAMGIATMAYSAGYTPKEFLSFATQASEMVRGTGISMTSAFFGGMDSLLRVREGMRTGNISAEAVKQAGGVENYALTVNRMGYDWASSLSGFTQFGAASAMGGDLTRTLGMNPGEAVSAAVGYLGGKGVEGILGFQGIQARIIGKYNPTVLAAMGGLQYMSEMQYMGIPISEDTYTGYLMTNYGKSATEAQMMYRTTMGGGRVDINRLRRESRQAALDLTPTLGSMITDRITNRMSDIASGLGKTLGITGAAESISDWVREEFIGSKEEIGEYSDVKSLRNVFLKKNLTTTEKTAMTELERVLGSEADVVSVLGTYSESGARALIREKAGGQVPLRILDSAIHTLRPKMQNLNKQEQDKLASHAALLSGTANKNTFDKIMYDNWNDISLQDLISSEGTVYDPKLGRNRSMTSDELTARAGEYGRMWGEKFGWEKQYKEDLDKVAQDFDSSNPLRWARGGVNLAITGGNYVFDWFTKASSAERAKQLQITENTLKANEKTLEPMIKTNAQLEQIAAQARKMGAIAGIGGAMINDPQLAMQSMQTDAMASGLKQIVDNTAVLKMGMVDAAGGGSALQIVEVKKK
jgi:hypothetical protein